MSSANEQHSQAELLFNLCKQTDPDSLCLKLAHLLQFSPTAEARAMSFILFRKQLTRDDSYLWPRLNPTTQSSLKTILLTCIQQEDNKSISKKRKRQLRNKDAAVRSREKRKMYVKDLEIKSKYFEAECRRLGNLFQCCYAKNHALRLSLQMNNAYRQ
ncbi:unnamed protein product [Malus baccata var. baccata]